MYMHQSDSSPFYPTRRVNVVMSNFELIHFYSLLLFYPFHVLICMLGIILQEYSSPRSSGKKYKYFFNSIVHVHELSLLEIAVDKRILIG